MSERNPAEVFPPGTFLRYAMERRGWTQNDLAEVLGRPVRLVNEIVAGKRAITPETAIGLGLALGSGAEVWLRLEAAYQLSKAKLDEGGVERRARLYSVAPVKDMARRSWIKDCKDHTDLEKELIAFFGCKSIDEIESNEVGAAARKFTKDGLNYAEMNSAQKAWLRRVRIVSGSMTVVPYKKARLESLVEELKGMLADIRNVTRVPSLLASYGIRFLVVEHLPKTRFDGVALWIEGKGPVIALTLRLDRIDYFWFTLLHELGHIAYEHRRGVDSNLGGDDPADAVPEEERLANEFAAEFLVPRRELEQFAQGVRPFYSRDKIGQFAARVKVHPGIVLGQLQKRQEVNYSHCREMLEKVRDLVIRESLTDGWGHFPAKKD